MGTHSKAGDKSGSWWLSPAAGRWLVVIGLVGAGVWLIGGSAFRRSFVGHLGLYTLFAALVAGVVYSFMRHGFVTGLARILGWPAGLIGAVLAILGGVGIVVGEGPGLPVFVLGIVLMGLGWLMIRDPSPSQQVVVVDEAERTDLDDLEQLGRLRDAGVLTTEEFEARKAQILGGAT